MSLNSNWLPGKPDYYLTDLNESAKLYGPHVGFLCERDVGIMTLERLNRNWKDIQTEKIWMIQKRPGYHPVPVTHFFKRR